MSRLSDNLKRLLLSEEPEQVAQGLALYWSLSRDDRDAIRWYPLRVSGWPMVAHRVSAAPKEQTIYLPEFHGSEEGDQWKVELLDGSGAWLDVGMVVLACFDEQKGCRPWARDPDWIEFCNDKDEGGGLLQAVWPYSWILEGLKPAEAEAPAEVSVTPEQQLEAS